MEEQQVDAIPLVADAQPPLAADEGEVAAEFEQEGFEVADEGVLEVGLGVLVLQAEELEDERVLDFLLGRDGVAGRAARPCGSMAALLRESAVRS